PPTIRRKSCWPVFLSEQGTSDISSRPAHPCLAGGRIYSGSASPELYPERGVGGRRANGDHASSPAGGFSDVRNLRVLYRTSLELPHLDLWRFAGSRNQL